MEVFQNHVVVETWAPPDHFEWSLSSSVAKQLELEKLKSFVTRKI